MTSIVVRLIQGAMLAFALFLGSPDPARAQEADSAGAAAAGPEATLTYLNRPIFTFRSSIGTTTPAERAERSHLRLVNIPDEVLGKPIEFQPVAIGEQNGIILTIGGNLLFGIAPGDIDPEYPMSVTVLAEDARSQLEAAFAARLEQQRLSVILRGLAMTAAATVLLSGLIWIIWRLRLRVREWFHKVISTRIEKAAKGRFQWRQYGFVLTVRLMQLITGFAILLLIYIWLAFALSQFPVTRPLGERLGSFFVELVMDLGLKAVGAIPGLSPSSSSS